jgi:hypothetical protein
MSFGSVEVVLGLCTLLASCGASTYLLTTGRAVATDRAHALVLSAEYDLPCPQQDITDVSSGVTLEFEGCAYRVTYEIRPYGDTNLIVLISREKLPPGASKRHGP